MSNQAALKLVGKEDGDKQRALEAALAKARPRRRRGSIDKTVVPRNGGRMAVGWLRSGCA